MNFWSVFFLSPPQSLHNLSLKSTVFTAKLWNKESDIFLQQISKMEDEHQKRTAELSSLADKVARDSDVLRKELENVKPSSPKDDEEAAELRRQLAQSDTDLCALRASNRELSEKMTNLEEQLAEYVASGKYLVESDIFLKSCRGGDPQRTTEDYIRILA